MTTTTNQSARSLRVLLLVEGNTDIRYVDGLSRICDLTMAIPARTYESSGLKRRLEDCGSPVSVHEIHGARLAFQVRSLAHLLREARRFDVILAQDVTRGALSANFAGRMLGVPVLNILILAPVEYFRCRRERGQIAWWKYRLGDAAIRSLMRVNGLLAGGWLALGPYLCRLACQYTSSVQNTHYYGVDVDYFQPADYAAKGAARRELGLPEDAFLVLVSSRISHEKDPETALRAVAWARSQGLNALAVNLGGGYQEFMALGRRLGLAEAEAWVLGRPAAHPMRELVRYYQAADVLMQASLAEGLGLSPLEALACGLPVAASEVGGMADVLPGFARLFPRGDDAAAAEQLAWVAANPAEARAQALRGREFVAREWNRSLAFSGLRDALAAAARPARLAPVV
jgi:glycosyltransferase involved in cell wall biosynthesis